MADSPAGKSRVFISYSHQDKKHLDRLQVHLKPLERNGGIALWSDSRLKAGDLWKEEIERALGSAQIAILLVSADYLASDFVVEEEVPKLLAAAHERGMQILPVVLTPCAYLRSPLSPFQAINDPRKPLSGMNRHEHEVIWQKVADAVQEALDRDPPAASSQPNLPDAPVPQEPGQEEEAVEPTPPALAPAGTPGSTGAADAPLAAGTGRHLYAGTAGDFIEAVTDDRIIEHLKDRFRSHFGYVPAPGEVTSWRNSVQVLSAVLRAVHFETQGVVLEYQLPLSSLRLDCLLFGRGIDGHPGAALLELKQWDHASASAIPECVMAYLGRGERDVLHPSRQAGRYAEYLEDCHSSFSTGGLRLVAASYLPNLPYDPQGALFAPQFQELLEQVPLFAGDQQERLQHFLYQHLGAGGGQDLLEEMLAGTFQPSKKLLEHTSAVIKGEKAYVLLDEQQVVFNTVLAWARQSLATGEKVTVLVRGGPGTGKSVIALNLLAELSAQGYNAQHATGSRAFTENIRKVVGSRAAAQFDYFRRYARVAPNSVDVLILDEAHRIRAISDTRFQKLSLPGMRQIDELIQAARVSVFFLDDLQVVRPGEEGSSELIRSAALKHGARLLERQLEAQFRCNGSDGFINWVDSTLDIRQTANALWDARDPFEVRIFDSPLELAAAIRAKAEAGAAARLTAGFCWPWSDPTAAGELVEDVVVDGLRMPWNAKPESTRLAPHIPKSHYWASDRHGIDQVGCIYTAQGFEFDYVGVIVGRDLVYDPKRGTWIGQRPFSKDAMVKRASEEDFLRLVKNTYRVLLTRGMKGCYQYFQDEHTRNFFVSRMRMPALVPA